MFTKTLLSTAAAVMLLGSTAMAQGYSSGGLSVGGTAIQNTYVGGGMSSSADGSGAKGKVIIRRPGRMRFEYAKPDKTVVLASSGQVAVFDDKSNQPPEQYPLAKTPLNLILGRKIDLEKANMVVGHTQEGKLTIVTAQDPKNPEYGSIALGFSANPVALRQWVLTDQTGAQTTVLLGDLIKGGDYPPSTFLIEAEIRKRGLN